MQQFYTKIIHGLRDAIGLSNNDYVVIDAIYRLSGDEGWCEVSRSKLADIAGISKRSAIRIVNRYSDELPEDCALLEKDSDGNVRTTEVWNATFSAITVGQPIPFEIDAAVTKVHRLVNSTGDKSSPGAVTKVHRNGDKSSPDTIYNIEHNTTTLSLWDTGDKTSPASHEKKSNNSGEPRRWYGKTLDELFDLFWKYYPDRGPARNPKYRARESFEKMLLKKDVDPQVIVKGAIAFAQTVKDWQGEERRSIPMASSWLNGREFNDFYEQYENKKRSRQDLIAAGFMPKPQAEKYSEDNYRTSLEESKGRFNIVEYKGELLFQPLEKT